MEEFVRRQSKFVRQQNIRNYKRQIAAAPPQDSQRGVLGKLLSEEETKEEAASLPTPEPAK